MPWLLTPGPLTTSRAVKQAMLADWGSRDLEFRGLLREIRSGLLEIAGAGPGYECVLMQGSGTFTIEAALASFCPKAGEGRTLVVMNGAYGERAGRILDRLQRRYGKIDKGDSAKPTAQEIGAALDAGGDLRHVFVVHCETTSGIVNPLEEIARAVRARGRQLIVDSMSAFGALPVDVERLGIDVLVSSSNKCIEGVPGFAYAICRRELLVDSKGRSHSLVLDLFDQWQQMEKTAQFRFTPPTHALVAFRTALEEHRREGGVAGRGARYARNRDILLRGMREMGFATLLDDADGGPIIQTFLTPRDPRFDFERFYEGLRRRGYAIYPGKLTQRPSFRIGTIGQIDETVMHGALAAIREVLAGMGVTDLRPAEYLHPAQASAPAYAAAPTRPSLSRRPPSPQGEG